MTTLEPSPSALRSQAASPSALPAITRVVLVHDALRHRHGGPARRYLRVAAALRTALPRARFTPLSTRSLADVAAAVTGSGADRSTLVVGLGGDGLVGAAAGPVADCGALYLPLPGGRGNDIARWFGLRGDPAAIAARLDSLEVREVDVPTVRTAAGEDGGEQPDDGDRGADGVVRMLSSCVVGWEARVLERTEALGRRSALLGRWGYTVLGIRTLADCRPHRYRLTLDEETREVSACAVTVCSTGMYGGGFLVHPARTPRTACSTSSSSAGSARRDSCASTSARCSAVRLGCAACAGCARDR